MTCLPIPMKLIKICERLGIEMEVTQYATSKG